MDHSLFWGVLAASSIQRVPRMTCCILFLKAVMLIYIEEMMASFDVNGSFAIDNGGATILACAQR